MAFSNVDTSETINLGHFFAEGWRFDKLIFPYFQNVWNVTIYFIIVEISKETHPFVLEKFINSPVIEKICLVV